MTTHHLLGSLQRGSEASAPRTLLDIVARVVATHPDAVAVDSGVDVLTYAELEETARELGARLTAAAGVGRGDRVGVRVKSGTTDLYVAILGVLAA